jgi:predicted nucleic acid-binding protein
MYVLDTSAWLTFIEDEDGADIVQDILDRADAGETEVLVSFMSFMEVYYISRQERDDQEAKERINLMAHLPIQRVDSNESQGILAAQLKAEYRLSVADCWIAALAIERQALLVHKDPEFEQVEKLLNVLKLPYKKQT